MTRLGMDAKENVQAIAWAIEIVTLITAAAIAVFVWRFAKRSSRKRADAEAARKKD